jgi:hypothetical protein
MIDGKNIRTIIDRILGFSPAAKRYAFPALLAFVTVIYLALLLRIHVLESTQPTIDQVTGQVKAARIPHIDQTVVRQIQTLQDNSVNVQALFNQARNNPFQ